MSAILDHEDDQVKNIQRSKKSFRYCIYALLVFFALVLLQHIYRRLSDRSYHDIYEFLYVTFLVLIVLISVLGFKNTIQSLIAKERWSAFKIIGVIGNFIIFGIVAIFLVAGMLDVANYL